MSLSNETRFSVIGVPMLDADGLDVLLVVVKGTYDIDDEGRPRLAENGEPVRLHDELYRPEDPRSSIARPTDLVLRKHGADVVVVGEAVAAKPVKAQHVAVKVGARTVELVVHGVRVFYDAGGSVVISDAQPFERMPVVYELAYGGMSNDLATVESRNPAGVGVARRAEDLIGQRAPQIELPTHPHTSSRDTHAPVGFGAIASHWSPRLEAYGTADEAWQRTRMPLVPNDHDDRFGNVAHPLLRCDAPLSPGEPLAVHGMSLEPIVTSVPSLPVVLACAFDDGTKARFECPIDTLVLEPSRRRIEVAGRAQIPLGRGQRALRVVRALLAEASP